MKTDPLVIERTYNAPIDKVWNVLINNDELKNWYFKLEKFKPELGFKFDFLGGPDEGPQYLHLCEITELVEESFNGGWTHFVHTALKDYLES